MLFGIALGLHGHWWPIREEPFLYRERFATCFDSERALFAGLMAAMTQRERDLLEPGL